MMNKKKIVLISLWRHILGELQFVVNLNLLVERSLHKLSKVLSNNGEFLSNFDETMKLQLKLKDILDNAKDKEIELEEQIQRFIDEFARQTKDQRLAMKALKEGTLTVEKG